MKKVFLASLAIFTAILVLNCSKEESKNNASLKPFELTPTEVKVPIGETTTLTISSGNGSYRINQSAESKEIVEITLSNENQNILIKALKSGTTTASVTDLLSKTDLTISIQAIIPPSYYTLSEDKKTLFKWNDTHLEELDLSSDPILKEITSIGQGAFKENSTLKKITLHEKIVFLSKESFAKVSKLETIKLPNSITSIGEGAFAGCTALKEVTLPENESFTSIPKRAFEECKSLSTLHLPNSINEIGILAFADAGLKEIHFPENLLTINQQAFAGNKELTEITIPKNVTLISLAAFQETALKTIKIEATLPPALKFGIDSQTQQAIEPFPSSTLQNIFVPEHVTQTYRDKEGWHNYATIINKNKEFKHLVIRPTEVTLFVDEVKQLEIVSGNDDYDLERPESSKEIAFIGITNNQKILGVRGKKVGAFKATIVDKITKEKVEISITVLNPFTLSPKQLTLTVGQSKEVIIDGNGDYEIPTNAHVTLSLSGDKKKLIVKGLQEGDTQVVIKDKKANLSATLSIKVTAAAPSIKEFSLSVSQLTLKMNEEKRVILQGNEDYEIGNSQMAQLTLSDDKKTLIVKAVKAGEETIKIKDKKANKELPLHIAVLRPFSINPSTLNIKVGQTQSIAVEGGGRYQISQNSLVEVVSQTEHLITFKGKTVGSGSISIKDERANKTLELTVKVTQALVPFHISPSTIHVKVGETKTVTITGNGKYELSKTSSPYVELTLNQAGTLTIKGKAKGEETLYVRDLNSVSEEKDKNDNKDHDSEDNEEAKNYESRKLTITILPATMEKQFEADGYTLSKWLDMSSEEVDFTQIPALKNIGMIGEGAFKGLTQLKKIVLPSSLEYIDFDAFAHCSSLESVKLQGNNLEEIARGAFSDCRNLRRLDIPSSVRKINGEAFNGCTSLRTIILRHTSVCSLHMAMGYIENLVAIYVPDSLVESYKNDMDWELYKNKIKPISELTNRKTRK